MTSSLGVTFNSSLEDGEVDDQFSFVLYELCVPLLFGAITFIGLAGNGLVLYAILSRDRMRTVTNLLLLNLAVADLAFVIVVPPFTAYQLATASWPFGSSVCRLLHYLVNVTAYVTVYTLVVIATVRYMTVVHGTQTARFRTRRNAAVAIGCLWVVMAGVNVPVLMSYELRNNECDVIDATTGRRIFATFFAFAYVGPLAVIGFLSAAIVHHIAGGGQRNRATAMFCDGSATAILPTVSIAPITVTVAAPSRAQMASERRRKQVGRLLLLVVALFAALWLPVHIHLLVAYFAGLPGGRFYEVVSVLWNCLAYFNSCVNPFIYNYTSKEFRDAFRRACSCTSRDGRRQSTVQDTATSRRQTSVFGERIDTVMTSFPAPRRKTTEVIDSSIEQVKTDQSRSVLIVSTPENNSSEPCCQLVSRNETRSYEGD